MVLTAAVSTFLFVHSEQMLCCLRTRPLCRYGCFSLVRYFLSVPAAMRDNDFLVNEQLCILFELFSGGNFSASLERSLCL